MPATLTEIEKKLWASADELRANSKLRSSEYSTPVLGLIARVHAWTLAIVAPLHFSSSSSILHSA